MASMEDIKVQLKQIDNRLVVEVVGKKVIVSKILEELSRAFNQNKNIEEVRIIATESIQVDADLKNDAWHGMNIAIQTNAVVVSKPVTWDVSGKNNDHIYPDNAGTDKDGDGVQGKDGYPGESGGNVLVLANRIENAETLTIISNGGKGSKGQDGGNGKDGENGKGITRQKFKEMFPPTAVFAATDRGRAIRKIIKTLSSSTDVVTQWAKKPFQTPITQDVLSEIRTYRHRCNSDIFIEVVNSEGNKITFSFNFFLERCQSFLLFKGAPGKPGGSGGVKGLGGQGGYAGEITVKNHTTNLQFPVKSFSNKGDEGESGCGGLFGNHGTNGNDMAYADYFPTLFSSWPKYYGMDENSKLSLNFDDACNSEGIYCPYKDYIGSDYKFCSISSSSNEQNANKKYQERNNSNRNNQKHHALSTRKKTILENRLRASFSDYLNVIEKTRKSAEMQRKSAVSAVKVATQTTTNATNQISEHSRTEVKLEHINLATTASKGTVQHQTQQIFADTNGKKSPQTTSSNTTKTSTVEKSEAQMGNLKNTSLSKVIIQEQEIHKSTFSAPGASTQNVSQNKQQDGESKIQSSKLAELKAKHQTLQISSDTSGKISTQTTSSNITQQTAEPITKQIALQCSPATAEEREQRNISKISEIVIATQNNVEESTKHQQDISETIVKVTELDVIHNPQETKVHQSEERLISDTTIEENRDVNLSNEQEQTIESIIKRHVPFVHEVDETPRKAIQLYAKLESSHGHICPVDLLNIDFKNIENWLILRRQLHSREELQHLLKIFETNKKCFIKHDSINQSVVRHLLIEKYRLATIEAINNQLTLYVDVQEDIHLTADKACTYLTKDRTDDKEISHPVLGRLSPYIHENSQDQREKLFRYCCNDLKDNIDMVKQTFILEIGHLEESPDCIKTFYDEYKIIETQREASNPKLGEFERQISQPKYANIFRLWKMRTVNGSANQELGKQIQNDSFLNSLWEHLNDQYGFQYDWTKCYGDQNVFDCLCKHIKNTGFASKTYRELLALIFDINLRIYEKDPKDDLILQENLNTTSRSVVYCLRLAIGFIQIGINKNHFKLHQERHKKDAIYKNILSKIRTLNHKPDLDKMLSSKTRWDNNSEESSSVENIDPQLILEYFPQEERHELKTRLSKLRPEYIGQEEILYHLHNRFSCEGRHISCEEMYFFINSILSHCLEAGQEKYTFSWLIAAYPQSNWMDELVLLHLENHFKAQLKEKAKWREYLSKIQNKEVLMLLSGKLVQAKSLTTGRMETVLYLLSNINRGSVFLEGLELSDWPYVLKEQYWLTKLEEVCNVKGGYDTSTASYYVLSIENMYGTELVENLLKILDDKIRLEGVSSNTFVTILSYFHNGKWNLSDADLQKLKYVRLNEWMTLMNVKYEYNSSNDKRNISQLVELITCNANSSENVKKKLPNIERSIIEINGGKYEIKKNIVHNFISLRIVDYEPSTKMVYEFTENDIRIWVKLFNAREYKTEVEDLQEMLAVIDRAIVLKRGFNLRDTQKLAVLTLLANDRSILAQVSTGEGKSLIVVAAAIMKALFGEKVDIVTSSSVLAKRDAENNNDIYSLFGIAVSHNCSEDTEKRREAYVLCQVVYGDLGNFQRDYLLDRFYGKNILGDRNFTNVIVDEVDSMLVDKGNNMLYLSHDIPWMDKLESVYLFIWQQINWLEEIDNETDDDLKCIEEAVLKDLYGMIREEDIAKIDVNLSDRDHKVVLSRLVNAKIVDERGRLLIESIDGLKISESLKPEFSRYTDRISFLLQEIIERERYMFVPNYLRLFVERHLKQWIKSAITAFYMNPGYNYVVDVDRTGTSSDRNANIIILDKDTGTDQANSQWDEALHQFLQLKHGCKLSMLSLKAVFISNVSYFKLYRQLYGLTGTLGSQTERDFLREIHDVDFVTIPTWREKQFREENPIVCCDSEEWINGIRNHALLITEKKKRSALIICETVKDAKDVYKHLRANGATNVLCYVRDYEVITEGTGDNKLDQGKVIIATNLAGRGTDIQITDALNNAGGLHVLLTYLPSNKRIEEQAFGRAARCGDKGSGQLIIVHSEKCELHVLKGKRDKEEGLRVSTIKSYYYNQIVAEEKCFDRFRRRYQDMYKELTKEQVPPAVQDILMQSCLDKWAFWLDENNEHITFGENKHKDTSLEINLNQLMESFESLSSEKATNVFKTDRWLPWVEENPAQMIKLGTYLGRYESEFLTNSYDNSLKLLNDVILREPHYSEAAHYNKAFVIAKKIDWKSKEEKEKKNNFKRELQEAARLFEKHSRIATSAAGLISVMKQRANKKDSQCEDIDGYKEQNKHIAIIYSMFIRSIDDILGHSITPESLQNKEIDIHSAENEFNKLLAEGILKKPKIKRENISKAIVRQIAKDYGIPAESLKQFLQKHSVNKMEKRNEFGEVKYNEERFGFDVDTFKKQLEKDMFLPGREKFWEILVRKEILQDEVIYVIVDKQKITAEEIVMLVHQLEQRKDKEHTIECQLDQIVLYEENLQGCQDLLMFKKDALDANVYDLLEKGNLLSTNKRATVDVTEIEDVDLQLFDSISIDDFKVRTNINEHDAKIIISELVEKHILQPLSPNIINNNQELYTLAKNFNEMPESQFLSCPLYEPVVKSLLEICFCYRLALQKIKRQLENGKTNERKTPIRIELGSQVHKSLFFELVNHKIIEQVKVNNTKLQKEKENTNTSKLYGTLEKLRGILKNPENLSVSLKPLMHTFGEGNFGNIEEMCLFFVNGLDHVLHFERNKLPKIKIFFITAIIGLIAVAKMAISLIPISTSKSLYFSGINDLIYATGVWRTQTFSWDDYKQHTLRNVLLLARDGLTGLRSLWMSTIGNKLLLPRFEHATSRVIATAPATFNNRKLLLGTVMDIPRISSTTEQQLQTLCKAIEQEFISIVMKTLEDYNMSYNLEKYVEGLSYPNASDTINMVIEDVFNERFVSEKYLPIATNIANFVTSGITNGISQLNIAENMIQDIGTLCNPTRWIERITDLGEIRNVTNDLLEALKSNIESKFEHISKQTEDQNTQTQTENNLEANSIEVWRRVDEQCNNILNKCVGHVVSQHVVTPIQKKCFDKMIQHIDSQMNTIS